MAGVWQGKNLNAGSLDPEYKLLNHYILSTSNWFYLQNPPWIPFL